MTDKYIRVQKKTKISSGTTFRLAIDINTILHLEIPNITSKIKVELIGVKHNDFLIANLPNIIDSEFVAKCTENTGDNVVCRYVYNGSAYGFRAKLMGIITTPIEIIVFQYPDSVEECNLRRYKRMAAVMPARIKFGTAMFYGSIKDVSEAGCQVCISNSTIDKHDIELIKNTFSTNMCIILKLPGIEKDIVLPAIRRNVKQEAAKLSIGVEFNNLDAKTEDMFKLFVAEMRKYAEHA